MLALAHIDSELTALQALYAARIYEFREKEIVRIGKLIREGTSIRDLLDRDELFGFERQLRNELLNLRTRIANFGRGQIDDELRRQGRL